MVYFFSKLHLDARRFGGLELQWEEISSAGPHVTTWTVDNGPGGGSLGEMRVSGKRGI